MALNISRSPIFLHHTEEWAITILEIESIKQFNSILKGVIDLNKNMQEYHEQAMLGGLSVQQVMVNIKQVKMVVIIMRL